MIHDQGNEFQGTEFQDLLNRWGIDDSPISVRNPQANAICERMHQVVASILRILLHSHPPQNIQAAIDIVDYALSTASHAMRILNHKTLGMSPGAVTFHRDMLLDIPFVAEGVVAMAVVVVVVAVVVLLCRRCRRHCCCCTDCCCCCCCCIDRVTLLEVFDKPKRQRQGCCCCGGRRRCCVVVVADTVVAATTVVVVASIVLPCCCCCGGRHHCVVVVMLLLRQLPSLLLSSSLLPTQLFPYIKSGFENITLLIVCCDTNSGKISSLGQILRYFP